MARVDLSTNIRGPIMVGQNIWTSNAVSSGCSVIDVIFLRELKVAGITFKNHHTAHIQVLLLCKACWKGVEKKHKRQKYSWIFGIPKMILMPEPHYEAGGMDDFSIMNNKRRETLLALMKQNTHDSLHKCEVEMERDEKTRCASELFSITGSEVAMNTNCEGTYEFELLPDINLSHTTASQ